MKMIVWTRSEDDWEMDKRLFTGIEDRVIHLPCIESKKIAYEIPLKSFNIFVFTSARAVRFAAEDSVLAKKMVSAEKIYTFCQKTYEALCALSLGTSRPDNVKSGLELAEFLSCNLKPTDSVMVVGAVKASFDIAGHLLTHGYNCFYLAIYETVPICAISGQRMEFLKGGNSIIICFASPSAVDGFIVLTSGQIALREDNISAVAIGDTTKSECERYFARVHKSEESTVRSLAEKALTLM
ncbi:MAG: uroporphyrinogen-III synthase [Oligoflexales bacterium]|nr:uroporphyrinogen-III synthase [Oligoflexales bacterium]